VIAVLGFILMVDAVASLWKFRDQCLCYQGVRVLRLIIGNPSYINTMPLEINSVRSGKGR